MSVRPSLSTSRAFAALGLLAGCSLSKFDAVPCTENLECRDAFGWGFTCDTDAGLCAETPTEARCERAWPEDLLSNRSA